LDLVLPVDRIGVKYRIEVGPTAGGHCVEAAYRNADRIGRQAVRCIDFRSPSKLGVVVKLMRDNRGSFRTQALFAKSRASIPWKSL
jgi:hypothetical protein